MVPQGMTKPTIARGLQPQLHHVEASELSVRPTLTLWRLRERPLSGVSQSLFWGIAASTLARLTDGRRQLGGEFLPKS